MIHGRVTCPEMSPVYGYKLFLQQKGVQCEVIPVKKNRAISNENINMFSNQKLCS